MKTRELSDCFSRLVYAPHAILWRAWRKGVLGSVGVLAGVTGLRAIEIVDYTPAVNNRFVSGFFDTPVMNTDPSYQGLTYDLSGVAWIPGSSSLQRIHNVTMITPVHLSIATHTVAGRFGAGYDVKFVNASGELITATGSAVTTTGFGADVSIGTLTEAFGADQHIAVYRVLDVANRNYTGLPVVAYGSNPDAANPGPQIGNAQVMSSGSTITWGRPSGSQTSGDALYQESGDSSSPIFIKYTAPDGSTQLTYAGGAYYATSPGAFLPSSATNYVAQMNNNLKTAGYALKWTIYDNPADDVRTTPRWTGGAGTGEFTTAGNWSEVPTNLPVLLDASAANGQTALTIGASTSVRGMLFKASSSTEGFVVSGPGMLTIGYTGLRNEAAATQTFNNAITLADSQNWEAVGGDFVFNGGVDTTSGGHLVVVGGGKNTVINGVVSGAGSLAKDDTGTLTLNATNTYAGTTFLHNGTLRLGAGGTLGGGDVSFVANNPAVLDLNGRSQSVTDLRSEYGGAGRLLLGGGTLTVNTSKSNAYAGSIEGDGSLIKAGTGAWTLAGTSNYTGFTQISGGTLRAAAGALPSGTNLRLNGGVLELSEDYTGGLGTGTGQVQFLASGGFAASGGTRHVNLGGEGSAVTWTNGHFLPNGASFLLSSLTSTGTIEFQNALNLGGSFRAVFVENGGAVIDARLTGAISNGSLVKQGGGTLELTAANDYSATQVNSGALLLSHASALGAGNVSFNGGILLLGEGGDFTRSLGTGTGQVRFVGVGGFGAYGADRTVNLGGLGETVTWGANGFTSGALLLSASSANARVDLQNAIDFGGAARTVQVADGQSAIDARMSGVLGNGGIVKSGTGTLELTGNNTYSGETRINAGTLAAGSAGALGSSNIILDTGGVLMLGAGNFSGALGTGAGQVQMSGGGGFAAYGSDRIVNLGGAGAALAWGVTANFVAAGKSLYLSSTSANAMVDFVNAIDLSGAARTVTVNDGGVAVDARMSGVLSNGGVTKAGAGTLELTGANTYTGATTVTEGALRFSAGALPASSNLVLSGGVVELGADMTRALGTGAGQIRFNGGGGFSAHGATRVVNIGGAGTSMTWGGSNFVQDGRALVLSSAGSDAMIDFRNALNLAGAASGWRTIQVNDGGAAIDARLSGVIYDNNQTFGWGLKKTGAGTLELAADSSYTRSTIVSEGTLIASGRMLATSEVSVLSGGKFVYRSALGALARPVSIEGGTFYYNSSSAFAGSLHFESGTLGGLGNLGNTAITVGAGRTINPGDGVGTLRSGSEIWADGGTYVWEINNLSGAKGAASGWDFLDINGSLNLTAGDDGFIIELTALGSLAGWNPHQTQSWIIATASAGIIGFDPGSLRVVTDSFLDEGTRGGGVFAVALMGNSLALTYTAVPEPAVLSLVLASVAGAYAARRRFRGRFAG